MRIAVFYFFLLLIRTNGIGQTPFLLNYHEPDGDRIVDVVEIGDRFYFLQNKYANQIDDYTYDIYSNLIITSSQGDVLDQYNLNGIHSIYQRIVEYGEDFLILAGITRNDSCRSHIIFSKLDLQTKVIQHLSSFAECDGHVLNLRMVEGLGDERFLQEFHTVGESNIQQMRVFRIDSSYNMVPVIDSFYFGTNLSVDFARKGYVMATVGLYNFYTADFKFRKQRYNQELHLPLIQTHLPFGKNWILEHSAQHRGGEPDYGLQVRVIDSTLAIRKISIILASDKFDIITTPFFGGVDIKNENEIWAGGYFIRLNRTIPLTSDTTFYSIAKLDSNLNIICQHFLGYDAYYGLFGLRALESGGAIYYGNRRAVGESNADIYALRVADNCGLPLVSVTDHKPFLAISVYPNPTINSLMFDVKGFESSLLTVEIFDVNGVTLFTQQDLTYEITVKDLPAGQYFYRILAGKKTLGVGSWVKS